VALTCGRPVTPAYTTTLGWIGYSDEKLTALCRKAAGDGFEQIKLKVGADPATDARRMQLTRAAVGSSVRIAVDANQRWGVEEGDRGHPRPHALAAALGGGADQPR
jgi:L-fuconate dehydratase